MSGRATLCPVSPALVASAGGGVWLSADGEIEELSATGAARRVEEGATPIVCHAPATAAWLRIRRLRALDVLELFAFARPARFCVPTPAGLAAALGLAPPEDAVAQAMALRDGAAALLDELRTEVGRSEIVGLARMLHAGGWTWGTATLAALSAEPGPPGAPDELWQQLTEWSEQAPPPPPRQRSVTADEALDRLAALTGAGAEERPTQKAYAVAAARAFAPRDDAEGPRVVLAEAGTGVGKTLGYLAPASVWAQKNAGAVWISTYTRNLQHQIDVELDQLYPDPARKHDRVVVRKGRENYLCLLNLEEELGRARLRGAGVGAGLVARWALATRDGDLNGDFPAWLAGLAGFDGTLGLADRRGDCVYSACRHYRRCWIERAQRSARRADLVIANHALTLIAWARASDGRDLPTRIVFDEGHHVFEAADAAFSTVLDGAEAAEMRHWIRGPEGGRTRRGRGLRRRVGDLTAGDAAAETALDAAVTAAAALPAPGWSARLGEPDARDKPAAGEAFLARVRDHVLAHQTTDDDHGYALEADTTEPAPALRSAAAAFGHALTALSTPLRALAQALTARLDRDAADLDADSRARIEATRRGLVWRAATLNAWRSMLDAFENGTPPEFVDWFSIRRRDGRAADAGLHRHFVDPTAPFAEALRAGAHGALITSASLRDSVDASAADPHKSWLSAEVRTGVHHLPLPVERVSLPSPFDYSAQTRVFLVTDVRRTDAEAVAAAMRELFLAAQGGALGLFTAVARLRAAHRRLAAPLATAGLPLLAQHVDAMDPATLVEIFRADPRACLLGTDAFRDGVDVPGDSLRLIAFDRVPWPRPDILHRARRQAFGGGYDDMITRLRLRQAFGRLIRRERDRGVFVLLDARAPTRLWSAFPLGGWPQRVGIAEAIRLTREFLA